MWRSVFGIAASLLLMSSPSLAQSTDGWSGFSVSLGGGAAKVDLDGSTSGSVSDEITLKIPKLLFLDILAKGTGKNSLNSDDWTGFGTAQAAYDQRFGNLLIGALIDFDFYPDEAGDSDTRGINGDLKISGTLGSGKFAQDFDLGPFPIKNYASLSSNIELDKVWNVGGRVGFLVTPNTLLYGLGGYSQASIDGEATLSYTNLVTGPQTLKLNLSDELHGFFVGAGGEFKFTDALALRLEYRYANYSGETKSTSASYFDSDCKGKDCITYTNSASLKSDVDLDVQTIRAAVVMKLGYP